jgi:hypothetical protein
VSQLYFGEWWDVPAMEGAVRVPETPTYARCLRCHEHFAEGDQGTLTPTIGVVDPEYLVGVGSAFTITGQHRECSLAGIVGHMVGVCSCTGYGHDRTAAREVLRRVEAGALELRP